MPQQVVTRLATDSSLMKYCYETENFTAKVSRILSAKTVMASPEKFPKVPGAASVSCLLTWLGTKGDYSSLEGKGNNLKGVGRYFSQYTKQGKVTIVVGTYLLTAASVYYMWNRQKMKPISNQ